MATEIKLPRLGQGPLPELVEVGRLRGGAPEVAEAFEGQVDIHVRGSSPGAASSPIVAGAPSTHC